MAEASTFSNDIKGLTKLSANTNKKEYSDSDSSENLRLNNNSQLQKNYQISSFYKLNPKDLSKQKYLSSNDCESLKESVVKTNNKYSHERIFRCIDYRRNKILMNYLAQYQHKHPSSSREKLPVLKTNNKTNMISPQMQVRALSGTFTDRIKKNTKICLKTKRGKCLNIKTPKKPFFIYEKESKIKEFKCKSIKNGNKIINKKK